MTRTPPTARAWRALRAWGITMTALWGILAVVGWLPGDTILLGFMTAAPMVDLMRTALALAFGTALFVRNSTVLAGVSGIAGAVSTVVGLALLLTPHLWGLVPTAATLLDSLAFLVSGLIGVFVWSSWRSSEQLPRSR